MSKKILNYSYLMKENLCLLMVYALGSWLPKLMMAAGYSMGSSLMFLLSLKIGAVIGTAGGGVLVGVAHDVGAGPTLGGRPDPLPR